jgi:molybdopterin molybdotransferase
MQTLVDEHHCIEIMTGAILPEGADTVIPVERTLRNENVISLESGYEPSPGQFIHRQGSDHIAGSVLLQPGITIRAPEMAVLTISGKPTVEITPWPRIVAISTGDELVDVGEDLAPFQIRSSNDRAIATACETRGCTTCQRARLPDDPDALRRAISELHEQHDVLILSGGVSMGKYDYVPQIMTELGVTLVFHKILQRPGLPMWFGISATGKPVFALPGNPVSSLVCLIRYVLPAIQDAMGATTPEIPRVQLAEAIEFKPDLTCFFPVRLTYGEHGELRAIPKPTNTSGDFVSLAGTDGVVELPRGHNDFPAGYPANFFPW